MYYCTNRVTIATSRTHVITLCFIFDAIAPFHLLGPPGERSKTTDTASSPHLPSIPIERGANLARHSGHE